MDQPQNDDAQVQNDEVVDAAQNQEQMNENAAPQDESPASQSVPITVLGDSDSDSDSEVSSQDSEPLTQDTVEETAETPVQPSEEVTEPASNEMSYEPAPVESPEAEQAEVAVEAASPEATNDELASVASELQALSESSSSEEPMVDEGIPSQQDGGQEGQPVVSMGTDPMDQIKAEEEASDYQAQSEPSNFASGEQENEMGVAEAPVEDASTDQTASEPVSQDAAVPVVAAPQDSNAEAVNMANQAAYDQEPARNPGDLISDVVAPTAVAAAVAEGTAGENAITGTPETASVTAAQEAPAAAQKVAKPKSGKGKLIFIVILVVLLFGGGAVAAYLLQPKKDTADSKTAQTTQQAEDKVATTDQAAAEKSGATAVTSTPAPGETVTAKALDDYKAACGGGTVLNATEYKGASPHPVVFFEKGSDDKYAMSVVAFKDKTWAADATKVASGQLAVCVSEKTASEKKIKTCPITDPTTKVTSNVDYYSANYTVDVYNAKTGAKLNSYESPSIVTDCPTTATYDKTNPKIVAKYDLVSVETLIKPDVTKAL